MTWLKHTASDACDIACTALAAAQKEADRLSWSGSGE